MYLYSNLYIQLDDQSTTLSSTTSEHSSTFCDNDMALELDDVDKKISQVFTKILHARNKNKTSYKHIRSGFKEEPLPHDQNVSKGRAQHHASSSCLHCQWSRVEAGCGLLCGWRMLPIDLHCRWFCLVPVGLLAVLPGGQIVIEVKCEMDCHEDCFNIV